MDFTRFNLTEFEQATGAERKYLAKTLDDICRDSGFLLISGQQVPTRVIQAQWAAVSTFFTLSQEHKKSGDPLSSIPLWLDWTRSRGAGSL